MDDRAISPSMAMSEEDQLKAAWSQLTLVQGFFSRIDTKLSVVLGLDLGMLAMLSSRMPAYREFTMVQVLCLSLCVAPLTASLLRLYRGAVPSTHGGQESLIYFGRIAHLSEMDFIEAIRKRTEGDLVADLYAQVWRNSQILTEKFSALQSAYRWLLIAILPWVVSLATFSTRTAPH